MFRKIIALVCSFDLVFLSGIASAQQYPYTPLPKSSASGAQHSVPTYQPGVNPNERRAHLEQEVTARVETGGTDPETEAQNAMIQAALEILNKPGHMNYVLEDLQKSVQRAGGNVEKAQVCDGKGDEEICVPALAYAQAALHNEVARDDIHQSFDVITGQNGRRTQYSGVKRPSCGGSTAALITYYGMPFQKYTHFKQDYKALWECAYESVDKWLPEDCSKGHSEILNKIKSQGAIDRKTWNDSLYASWCENEISTLPALAVLAHMGGATEKKNAAAAIHKRIKKGTGGAPVIVNGVQALVILGTQDAMQYLTDFLTKETIPSYMGDAVDAGLAHPAKSLVSAGICVAESVKQGECPEFSNRLNETFFYPVDGRASGGKDVVNRPLRSTYEDIGEMLVELSATYPALKDVNRQIMSKVQSGRRQYADKAHLPLVAGMMQGFVKNASRVSNATIVPQDIVQYLLETDWYDLNEPTQRRMHKQAHEFSRAFHRGVKLPANFDPTFPEDKAKAERFKKYQNAFQGAHYADTIYNAAIFVGLGMAVVSLGKGLVKTAITYTTTGKRVLTVSRVKAYFKLREMKKAVKGKNTQVVGKGTQQGTKAVEQSKRPTQSRAHNGQSPRLQSSVGTGGKAGNVSHTKPIANLPQAKGAKQGIKLTGGRVTPDPVQVEKTITGPLDAHVQGAAGNTPAPSGAPGGKSFGQKVKDFWTDYRTAMRKSNALQSGIPGIPAPGTFGAARAERIIQETAELENAATKTASLEEKIAAAEQKVKDAKQALAKEQFQFGFKYRGSRSNYSTAQAASPRVQAAAQEVKEAEQELANLQKALQERPAKVEKATGVREKERAHGKQRRAEKKQAKMEQERLAEEQRLEQERLAQEQEAENARIRKAQEYLSDAMRYRDELTKATSEITLSSSQTTEDIRRVESALDEFKREIDALYEGPKQEKFWGICKALTRSEDMDFLEGVMSDIRVSLRNIEDASVYFQRESSLIKQAQGVSSYMQVSEVTHIGQEARLGFLEAEEDLNQLRFATERWYDAHEGAIERIRSTRELVYANNGGPGEIEASRPFVEALMKLENAIREKGASIDMQLYNTQNALQDGKNTMQVLYGWKDVF